MSEGVADARWFQSHDDLTDARVQLFCLPAAGMGASAYRNWQAALGPAFEVIAVQLPGRENRIGERPLPTVELFVEQVTGPLLERADRPFALFGHSLGALLSFEVAHELVRRGRPPAELFVSGLEAAHHRAPAPAEVHELPDPELLEYVLRLGGISSQERRHVEVLSLFLPTIRADFAAAAAYRYRSRPPLPVPITALAGREDPLVDPRRLAAWAELSRARVQTHLLPGEHFYLDTQRQAVLDIIRSALGSPDAAPAGASRAM
ncbi:thioesterase II family protein [Nonomuraea sp. MTCD27]|uniref:thioesterase II family protein n=1 Tax=Nonomuraea sp. MTCD27 TaxID=1676747 RepID=UPI0035BEEA8F